MEQFCVDFSQLPFQELKYAWELVPPERWVEYKLLELYDLREVLILKTAKVAMAKAFNDRIKYYESLRPKKKSVRVSSDERGQENKVPDGC